MQKHRLLVCAILVLGAGLRLAFPWDYELKADEQSMVQLVSEARSSGSLPWLGMPTSQGFRNPGMSVWPFVGLSFVVGSDAFWLTQGVRILNILAFALALLLVRKRPEPERELWLWGLLLAAVNPLEMVLHRKLWAQSLLPVFAVVLIWLWIERRRSPWHAFGYGAISAVIAQIHLAGFFVIAGFCGTALFDPNRKKDRWHLIGLGFLAFAWPLLFWVQHLSEFHPPGPPWLRNVITLRYFHLLLSNLSGVVMSYSLGDHFETFLSMPFVYLSHLGLILGTLAIVGVGVVRWRSGPRILPSYGFVLLLCGLCMTLAGVYVERHYYLGLFPLPYLWFATLAFRQHRPRRILLVVVGLQLVVSVAFLWFIHLNGGAPGADFGALPGRG